MPRPEVRLACACLCLAACTPKVPADLTLADTPPKVRVEAEPGRAPTAAYDLAGALDRCEALLLGLDALMNEPDALREIHHEQMGSWLENEGLRSLYYFTKQLSRTQLVLDGFANMFGTPVFSSGPHGDELDYHSTNFGHYNPEFVARVGQAARALAQDPARVERTRGAFERRLRRQALTYLIVYEAVHHDPAWFERFGSLYKAEIDAQAVTFSYYEELVPLNEAMDRQGMSWHETDTAAYFWLRREFDGTAALWRDAITALLTAYGVSTDVHPPALPRSAKP